MVPPGIGPMRAACPSTKRCGHGGLSRTVLSLFAALLLVVVGAPPQARGGSDSSVGSDGTLPTRVEILPSDEAVSLLDADPAMQEVPTQEVVRIDDVGGLDEEVVPQSTGDWFRWPSWQNRVTAGADYLLLRPNFSNATAMYRSTTSGIQNDVITARNYDFGYSSGVRGFVGYWLNRDWMVRFGYMNIAASDTVTGVASGNWIGGNGTAFLGPGLTQAILAGESIRSEMGVVLGVYDLELAGRLNAADACSGDTRWEAAGSVGIRFADTTVKSSVYNDARIVGTADSIVNSARNFRGVGPRLALQGRRYLGRQSRFSLFATGGVALLVGSYENTMSRFVDGSTANPPLQSSLDSQRDGSALVVPNVDLSLGGSWQVTDRTAFSAGWMVMYWSELGYAQQIDTNAQVSQIVPFPATLFPTTNSSLAYDGVFFRLTHTF